MYLPIHVLRRYLGNPGCLQATAVVLGPKTAPVLLPAARKRRILDAIAKLQLYLRDDVWMGRSHEISYNIDMSGSQPKTDATNVISSEYVDGLYRYAMAITRNRADAEDLVQETYVRALEAVERLRDDSNIQGWLFTILRNLWFNQLRKRRNSLAIVEMDGDSEAGNARDAYAILASSEDGVIVRSAIDDLPIEFREVILLREFEELSYQEIADVLGCPAGTVMSRLARARTKLRTALTEMGSPRSSFGKRNLS